MTTQPYADWHRERMCTRKTSYGSKADARHGARLSAEMSDEPRALWTTYRCPHCRAWHVAHVTRPWTPTVPLEAT